MSFSSVWVSVPASTLEWAHRFSGKGWWLAQPPSPSPKRCFSGKWGPISQGMTLPRAHFFCFFFAFVVLFCLLFCCFVLLFYCFCLLCFYFLPPFFLRFLSKSIQFRRSPIRIGDLPFRLVTCPLGSVSLNIGRSSSASRVHLGSPFSSFLLPLSSAQVLLPCPGQFVVSMCAAFGTFPFPWLHFLCLYSPHIMSPPSNLHWLLPCILHLSNVPPSKLHLLFLFFLHLQFLPLFNLHFAFPFVLQLSCVPLSDLHFPIPFFCIVSPFFSRCILEQAQFDSTILEFVKGC